MIKIGCPREIKAFENRVALIPSVARSLVTKGAQVFIEKGAGENSQISDELYQKAGAVLLDKASELWAEADLIVKVKEPLSEEFKYFRKGQSIFTFLHLAAEPALARALLDNKVSAIAYETIEENGQLPILKPMSEVAGRMAVQVGAWCLEKPHGGKGILLGGVPGVRKARVSILGAGIVGKNAAKMALGMGADVSILDISGQKLEEMDDLFAGSIKTLFSNEHNISREVKKADLVIGAVLLAGARAPCLVNRAMIKSMEQGSALVDVSVDQGACIETIKRTTHAEPTYIVDGVVHYGVANMPGAVSSTSTVALAQAVSPYLLLIVEHGVIGALNKSPALLKGLNTLSGLITHNKVAEALDVEYHDPVKLLSLSK